MSTSARKENRWRKQVYASNDAISDRQREREAAFMPRGPRPDCPAPKPTATRRQVRTWMRQNVCHYDNLTNLAEAANAALDLPAGAMDEETHWVWEESYLACKWAGKTD